jgi:Ca2+-binding RTX toxin-like protein
MAKFTYQQQYEVGFGQFNSKLSLDINNRKTEAVWTNKTGGEIILNGTGFKGNSEEFVTAGQITSIEIFDEDHDKALTVTHLDVKATKLMDVLLNEGPNGLLLFLTKGDDRVVGNGSEDLIFGGAGDDVLTGKGGSDMFHFGRLEQRSAEAKGSRETDVITDFDTTGENADALYADPSQLTDYKKANNGKDTLISFEGGSSLLLEGVKRSEFKEYLDSMIEM